MLRVAMLGAGRIGKIHAANIAADRRPNWWWSPIHTRMRLKPSPRSLAALPRWDCASAIEREDVDAVLICTPTDTHVDLMLRAVKLGKPVLCEKPIDLEIERARAAVELVEKTFRP